MNIQKNKSIRKGFVFSKGIFPAVGALALVTQMGCGQVADLLGITEPINKATNESSCLYIGLNGSEGVSLNDENYQEVAVEAIQKHLPTGTEVRSFAQKFVIFIPTLDNGGQPPVYPPEDPNAGKTILDYQGKPIDYHGFVFVNPTDKCYQVAKGDGTGVLIINQPTQEQVEKLVIKLKEFSLDSIEQFKKLIWYMGQIYINDFYSSNIEYVDTSLIAININTASGDVCYGLYKTNDEQICKAVFIPQVKLHSVVELQLPHKSLRMEW